MMICSYCNKEFVRARHCKKKQNLCSACISKEFRLARKKNAVEFAGGKCEICGYKKCVSALQFHHRNPMEKDFEISKATCCWKDLVEEIKKCILICSNCHAELHEKEDSK